MALIFTSNFKTFRRNDDDTNIIFHTSNDVSSDNTSEDLENYLSSLERWLFFTSYVFICSIAVVGNLAAVFVTSKRKHRYIQKTFIISLALSDFLTATSVTIIASNFFLQESLTWHLGNFMCSFGPAVSVFGVVCSCASLVGIALDRYRNVVHAFKRRWNPKLSSCLIAVSLLWLISAGIAYPMFTYYTYALLPIRNDIIQNGLNYSFSEFIPLCIILDTENELKDYIIALIFCVFLPLLITFLWFYYKIAQLVWRHRNPFTTAATHSTSAGISTMENSTQGKLSDDPNSKFTGYSEQTLNPSRNIKSKRNQHKIRTFKVILFLMFIFLILRLPQWVYDVLKVNVNIVTHDIWIVKYVCTLMVVLNSALNPLFYTFLNETIKILINIFGALENFCCEICCCCFSNKEFQEFEKENPFYIGSYDKKIDKSGNITPLKNNSLTKF